MELGLGGKRAAIAGGSSGLGLATARALAREGVRVAICGRDRSRAEAAAREIGATAIALVADVSEVEQATGFVSDARSQLGGLDILVSNAGGPPPGTFESTPVEAYSGAIALNLMSVVAMCKEAVPAMREQGWGRVVAITSLAVRAPLATLILSNTARAGATGFLKTLAREVAGDGVTVNSLQPGLHATRRLEGLFGADLDTLAEQIPAGALGRPEDFGAIAAFLCSESARFITGAAIPVDGGSYEGLL
ncbi:MAG: SDR family oxidoreductase [Deltaproteobacteria bacterium]|nr:SDR family oxidoreductase [Deltaproteobacteria bacterium]